MLIILSIVMMTGCADKEKNPEAGQSKSHPQEDRLITAQGGIYEVFSPAGVYVRTEMGHLDDILDRSYNNWEFYGDDQAFMIEGIFTDLEKVPDIRIKDPIGNEITLSDFKAEKKIDKTGRHYQLVSWEQRGFSSISISCLNKEQFRKNWIPVSSCSGSIKPNPIEIYPANLAEGEVWQVRISGELKF
jgi:hypothetical protein